MISPAEMQERSERWRPWRAYAAAHLLAGAADIRVDRPAPRVRKAAASARRLAHAG
jgi:3-methyladenine DNA glycosylase/8-oxoguanine DNA glycosylase